MDYTFTRCVELFMEHLERNCYSTETADGYSKDLEYFRQFVSQRTANEQFLMTMIQKDDLIAFMDDGRTRGNKPSTVGRRLSTLKSFYKFLVYELDFPFDVAARIRVPKAYIPLKGILSEGEVKRLLSAAEAMHPYYHLLFSILYYTGSRLTPVRTLEKRHVQMEKRIIYFPKVKGGKDQYLPLHNRLRDLFDQYFTDQLPPGSRYVFPSPKCPDQPISASHIRNKLRIAATLAGIDTPISPHTLRHCTATHLTIQNVPQHTIASILGHTDLRSTMRYQHLAVDYLREALEGL